MDEPLHFHDNQNSTSLDIWPEYGFTFTAAVHFLPAMFHIELHIYFHSKPKNSFTYLLASHFVHN